MLKFINNLCKNKFLREDNFEKEFSSIIKFEQLINYKHPHSGDTVIHYACKCGNFELLRLIYNRLDPTLSRQYFQISNTDGKNPLHEVNSKNNLSNPNLPIKSFLRHVKTVTSNAFNCWLKILAFQWTVCEKEIGHR
jgi:hypothetical protein